MSKLTYEETLQHINEECPVDPTDVQSAALRRRVWIAQSNYPGCLPEYMAITTTRRDAIGSLLAIAEGGDGPPRGMKASLQRNGDFHYAGMNYSIEKSTLEDIL